MKIMSESLASTSFLFFWDKEEGVSDMLQRRWNLKVSQWQPQGSCLNKRWGKVRDGVSIHTEVQNGRGGGGGLLLLQHQAPNIQAHKYTRGCVFFLFFLAPSFPLLQAIFVISIHLTTISRNDAELGLTTANATSRWSGGGGAGSALEVGSIGAYGWCQWFVPPFCFPVVKQQVVIASDVHKKDTD